MGSIRSDTSGLLLRCCIERIEVISADEGDVMAGSEDDDDDDDDDDDGVGDKVEESTVGQNQVVLRHLIIHFPTSEGVSEVSKRANE